ncbi:MAG: excinuclease ABC subunit UvrC [Methylophilaceae bacterium]|nr:excinuclease ABC subunit UvrC [Methylophilaceae bacterium]
MSFEPQSILKNLPHLPGVYRMLNHVGEPLYIGKAKDLKKRVASYFNKTLASPRTRMMVGQIADIQFTVTHNEAEALLLENNLIKNQKPRYNILFRDDKSYPYIALSEHAFPRLSFQRGASRSVARIFGPFPHTLAVRESIQLLQKVFKLRTCENSVFAHRNRPCLEYQIKRCSAPCVGLIDEQAYAQDVAEALLFLEGKTFAVIDQLTRRMEDCSQRLAFEEAAMLRDRIQALRHVQTRQFVSNVHTRDADVVVGVEQDGQYCVNLVMIRGGRHLGDSSYFPHNSQDATLEEAMQAFIMQHYTAQNTPPLLISQPIAKSALLREALHTQIGHPVALHTRAVGDKGVWLKMAETNARLALQQHLSSQQQQNLRFISLCDVLALPATRMECFDISHIMGEATVGSCVVFDRGDLQRGEYRRYNIQTTAVGDDYAAMRELLTRRYSKVANGEGVRPSVIFVDGGRGQLGVALEVMQALGLSDIPLLGIAKGEGRKPGLETLFKADGEVIHLPHDHPGFHLLQHLRDEAHRFAISGHRAKRAKTRNTSRIEEIAGIGAVRRRALMIRFGGIEGVKNASIEELSQVSGISILLAKLIYEALH